MSRKQLVSLNEADLKAAFEEQTLILCKPESVQLGVFAEILSRLTRSYLKLNALKMFVFSEEAVLDFYGPVIEMWEPREKIVEIFLAMTRVPSVLAVYQGPNALAAGRKIAGGVPVYELDENNRPELAGYEAQFKPIMAPMGTIRGDYSTADIDIADTALLPVPNFVHASASKAEFERETDSLRRHGILREDDFFDYERPEWKVLYGDVER